MSAGNASAGDSVEAEPRPKRPTPKIQTVVNMPYFTPAQIERLSTRARANKMAANKWMQTKMSACAYIEAVGAKMGFPQRTIGTAQLLYQRFHLFYPPSDFVLHEVALAALFTASKLNDTQKRIHDFLMTSYAFRYPELLHAPPSDTEHDAENGTYDWIVHAHVAESDVDAEMLAQERGRLLVLERLLLQCICFQFNLRAPQNLRYVVKVARRFQMAKSATALAWRIACDSHRTYAPLIYPPQTVALGCVYTAVSLLHACGELEACLERFTQVSGWDDAWQAKPEDVEDVAHHVLDLYVAQLPSMTETQPSGRAVPLHVSYPPPLGLLAWRRMLTDNPAQKLDSKLTQIKIRLRQDAQQRNAAMAAPVRTSNREDVRGADDALPATMYTPEKPGTQTAATRYLLY
ncbi:beta-glucosidase [Malassezia vespertilionis]|nr:beta-glucosidase [Malassezia vespertilionis]WFD06972.1 beta-glucosidase [Malassezia vespertilionis]